METPFPPGCARRFVAERVLASGGFGTVVLATQLDLRRPVVVKLLHASSCEDPEMVERFVQEARVTASLRHPNIVRLIDHGLEDGVPWIVYEYLEGRDLEHELANGPLALAAVAQAGAQIAAGLGAAHRAGVVHRDIKPANILRAADGACKIVDFGIARWTAGPGVMTRTGVLLGTPSYIAPELVGGAAPSPASDIYALGATLYQLATGRPPFEADSPLRVLEAHLKVAPRPPSEVRPDLPPRLSDLILRCLTKEPGDRPLSGDELARELLPERSPPGGGRRVGPATRPAPPAGRSRMLRAAGAAVALTVGLCLVMGWPARVPRGEPSPPVSTATASVGGGSPAVAAESSSVAPLMRAAREARQHRLRRRRYVHDLTNQGMTANRPDASAPLRSEFQVTLETLERAGRSLGVARDGDLFERVAISRFRMERLLLTLLLDRLAQMSKREPGLDLRAFEDTNWYPLPPRHLEELVNWTEGAPALLQEVFDRAPARCGVVLEDLYQLENQTTFFAFNDRDDKAQHERAKNRLVVRLGRLKPPALAAAAIAVRKRGRSGDPRNVAALDRALEALVAIRPEIATSLADLREWQATEQKP